MVNVQSAPLQNTPGGSPFLSPKYTKAYAYSGSLAPVTQVRRRCFGTWLFHFPSFPPPYLRGVYDVFNHARLRRGRRGSVDGGAQRVRLPTGLNNRLRRRERLGLTLFFDEFAVYRAL